MEINIALVALVFWAAASLAVAWLLDRWQAHRQATRSVPVLIPHYTRHTTRIRTRR
jgi:hypothetical protein